MSEVSSLSQLDTIIALDGSNNQSIQVDTGRLFDIGFSISTEGNNTVDALYLADGPWGLDYLENEVIINSFTIDNSTQDQEADSYIVERNPSIIGTIRQTMNLFRHLKAGDQVLNIEDADHITFAIKNNLPVEVILITDQDIVWENRLRFSIPAHEEQTNTQIKLSDFTDAVGNSIPIENVRSVVFSISGDYTNFQEFELNVSDVSFGKSTLSITTIDQNAVAQLQNFPNPFVDSTSIQLTQSSNTVTIQVYDMSGRTVDSLNLVTTQGGRIATYRPSDLGSGIYVYTITYMDGTSNSGKLIKR